MTQADTLSVLRDVFFIGMLGLAAGLVVYKGIREGGGRAWNLQGNVLARPYNVLDGFAALLLLTLMGGTFILGQSGTETAKAVDAADRESISALVAGMVYMSVVCGMILVYLRFVRGMNPPEIFGLRQMSMARALLLAVPWVTIAYIAMVGVNALIEDRLPDSGSQEIVESFRESGNSGYRIMTAFMAIVFAPLTEEFIFRGFLYGITKRFTDRWFAAIFSAIMFYVVHFHVGSALPLFVLGVVMAVAYEQTGSLYVPLFMHAIFNAVNIIQLVAST